MRTERSARATLRILNMRSCEVLKEGDKVLDLGWWRENLWTLAEVIPIQGRFVILEVFKCSPRLPTPVECMVKQYTMLCPFSNFGVFGDATFLVGSCSC